MIKTSDSRAFRHAMGQFATGVTVVTGTTLAMDGETAGTREARPLGFVAQSFVSVSLDPPLIAVCPGLQSTSWPQIRAGGRFTVNVLAADQQAVCDRFARSGGAKFDGLDWMPGANGCPLLPDAILQVECDLHAEHEAGDHWIAIGAVTGLQVLRPDAAPLVFFRGAFPTLASAELPAAS